MVGKDISKISLPVILNEPLSSLQRNSEVFQMNWLIEKAVKEKCALMRLVYISSYAASL